MDLLTGIVSSNPLKANGNVIKLFSLSIGAKQNKLDCFSLIFYLSGLTFVCKALGLPLEWGWQHINLLA